MVRDSGASSDPPRMTAGSTTLLNVRAELIVPPGIPSEPPLSTLVCASSSHVAFHAHYHVAPSIRVSWSSLGRRYTSFAVRSGH